MNKKKEEIQFRYYHLPEDAFVFAKLGPEWIREYGRGIDYLHVHNLLEIGCCRSGTGEMVYGDKIYPYQAGDITMIPRKYPHTTNSTPGTMSHWEYLFINDDAFIEKIYAGQEHRLHRDQMIRAINREAMFFSRETYPGLSADIEHLMECQRQKEPFYQEESEGILGALLSKIARIQSAAQTPAADEDSGRIPYVVLEAMEYIAKHYAQALSVEEIARQCNVSETHLRRLFSTHLKTGVLEYVNFIRVQQACRLLQGTDDSISDISYHCGFLTISTFNRNFKRITGENPGTWRSLPENMDQKLQNYPIHSEHGW